jgi:hypothetical protein
MKAREEIVERLKSYGCSIVENFLLPDVYKNICDIWLGNEKIVIDSPNSVVKIEIPYEIIQGLYKVEDPKNKWIVVSLANCQVWIGINKPSVEIYAKKGCLEVFK